MRPSALIVLAVLGAGACGSPSVVAPTYQPLPVPTPPNPPEPLGNVAGVYRATLVVSPSCASALPVAARERTYTAKVLSDGRINWSGTTLNSPPGHATASSATVSEDVFSFFIDVDRDPLSDDFHGLWDTIGDGTILNISGNGRGPMHDGEITGVLDGVFALFPNTHICRATDHRFTFVKQ